MSLLSKRTIARAVARHRHAAWIVVFGIGCAGGDARASPIIDAINPNAAPAFNGVTYVYYGSKDVGWYYTPSTSYDLDGVAGKFLGMEGFAAVPEKTLTVELLSERPVNGGTVLRQADFTVQLAQGGVAGGTFAPLRVLAGTTYFVALLNVENVGINVGTWVNDGNGNPLPSGGATVNLGAWYRNFGSDTDFATQAPAYATVGGVNMAGGEPILYFSGTPLPEPSTAAATLLGGAALLARRHRHSVR